MMSCDDLYFSQSFPPLGISDSVLEYGEVKIINLEKVQVQQPGQILLESNFIVGFAIEGLEVTLNVLRDGQTIIGGPQILVNTAGFGSVIDDVKTDTLAFSIVDSDVKKGVHSYSLILTNITPNKSPISIQTYSVTIKSFSSQKLYSTQSYPVSGTPALTIGAGETASVNLSVDCESMLLSTNLNVIFLSTGNNVLFNILRADLTSVINGPQTLLNFPAAGVSIYSEYNFTISVLDPTPSESYTLQLINYSTDPVKIDFYSFIGQSVGKIGSRQEFPPLGNTISDFLVSSSIEIPLKFHAESGKPVQLAFNANFIASSPVVLFEIIRDGKSITNGKQIFFRITTQTLSSLEANQNILVVDNNPCPGKFKYILKLYNIGFTDLTLDYYSFTAQQ